MQGVILPGRERVEIKEFERPDPGPGQVLVQMKASGLCGSDLRFSLSDTGQAYETFDAGRTGKVVISWEDI
jgi:(R,R)-butanediol dehydrogenase/meso-butanediol dehydrogenase/diacetyl reductase